MHVPKKKKEKSAFVVNLQLSLERQEIVFAGFFPTQTSGFLFFTNYDEVLVFLSLFDFSNTTPAIEAPQNKLTKPVCNNLWPPLWNTQRQHLKQRIYQMAATNSQVAKCSLGDSRISAAGFLSGPEEWACSLSNWITGLFLISKGCEPSRGLAWWNQSGSWSRGEKNNKSFSKVSWHGTSS